MVQISQFKLHQVLWTKVFDNIFGFGGKLRFALYFLPYFYEQHKLSPTISCIFFNRGIKVHVDGAPRQPSPVILSPDGAEGQSEQSAFEDFTDLTFGTFKAERGYNLILAACGTSFNLLMTSALMDHVVPQKTQCESIFYLVLFSMSTLICKGKPHSLRLTCVHLPTKTVQSSDQNKEV